jgi:tRNA-specific 2-thiouridylase
MSRIVVAMSGGVDSSVAAALLVEQGLEVVGVSMQLYDRREGAAGEGFGSCCSLDDLQDARRVAASLGVPHYIMNFERQFATEVVDRFVEEYLAGRTPIPCTRCNSELKFATLLDRARALGAEQVATGHYARIATDERTGRLELRRGLDHAKDQSYFLFSLDQSQLARSRFPVGELGKPEVREHARRLGLRVAGKPDSQEICFVPDGDYAAFIERRAGAGAGGPIVHVDGSALGSHGGIHRFTVGQRKGLGLSAGRPLYVVAVEPDTCTVVVGPPEALDEPVALVEDVNWVSGEAPGTAIRATVQIRHRHAAAPATVTPLPGRRARVRFDAPQRAITPGQAAVFYDGDVVAGGGWIGRRAECPTPPPSPRAAGRPR